ncbi:MAG TPA: carbamate kinase [Kiritimatiellia bacterium]|nr:carbamate kinase [Kiritimatiellia bacterium]HMO97513.1 carbamate kinase [Kiritimatiellia bacterium]HMP97144.1 carbamate kinase [Kiritimatiellia bacterium]
MSVRKKTKPLAVIAIGGNSLITDNRHMTVLDQYRAAGETSHHIAALVKAGYRVVVTHGNGPQVGFILLRSEIAKDKLHQVPLESCVADTQGAIGYQIQQTLENELRRLKIWKPAATVVTQVVVDKKDPAFKNPSKPIGPFYSEVDARQHAERDGWAVREDAGRGWRRVVPSPKPREIIEEPVIRALLESDVIVIAVGGGGIPVVRERGGRLRGCAAVIDKDAASSLLARHLGADVLIISTGVDYVCIHYGKPEQRALKQITLAEARRYLKQGHFADGSMKPKIEAAIAYLRAGGKRVIITQPHLLEKAVAGKAGTHIVP